MSLENFYYISQIVASFAVLASLIYLALQTRQTSKNQRALMNQGAINRTVEINMWLAEPHMARLTARINSGTTKFTAEEIVRLRLRLRATMNGAQDYYVQHKAGHMDKITFDNGLNLLKAVMTMPIYRALWNRSRTSHAPEWVAFVENLVKSIPLASPRDLVAELQADLAEVMR